MPKTNETIEPIQGWYVAETTLLTSRTHLPIREGETLTLDDPRSPETCAFGYHASERLLDAFGYRTDGVICLVEVSGDVDVGHDKVAGRSRKTLRIIPREVSDKVSREFACDVAERMLLAEREAGREPAPESFKAIAVSRAFAAGESSAEELVAAAAAAWAAAARAARAAWEAVEAEAEAARAAERAAAWAAERAAAWAAARAAEAAEAAEEVVGVVAETQASKKRELSLELEARLLAAIATTSEKT